MAETPEKGVRETPREAAEREEAESSPRETMRRSASGGGREQREISDDLREEEGWTQPESSAQKGAEPDQEEG
jgi:hypothetical protein